MKISASLPEVLLPWYQLHKRDLPWRVDHDPYHIWVSEIMLQQTRVEAVKGYYARFMAALPSVQSLACCDDDVLRKLWEGLGYYSRVRNLKIAAIIILEKHHGRFPSEYDKIRALPGIGDYTAGAISSIAFSQKTPAVDGNVLRVISRLNNDSSPVDSPIFRKSVSQALSEIYPEDASSFTQALMELGATICGPNRKPDCENCPCSTFCEGYHAGTAETLPVKSPKKAKRSEDMTVFILRCGDRYGCRRRPEKGLLAGLWEFPNTTGKLDTEYALHAVEEMGVHPSDLLRISEKNHIFTHIIWNMRAFYITVQDECEDLIWMTEQEINETIALPTAFRQFWIDKL